MIGEPLYSENGSHVMLAGEKVLGVPTSAAWCKGIANGCADAHWMRARYLKAHPGTLKSESPSEYSEPKS